MRIAKLNHRIDILEPFLTSDGYGGYASSFTKFKSVWAEVKSSSSSEQKAFNTSVNKSSITMRIRPLGSVRKGWHVLWQGREYEIISVKRLYKDSAFLEIIEYEAGV